MTVELAELLVRAMGAYIAIGLLFALAFVTRGASRLDPAARQGSWGFRVLILPASVALWPWLALRWWRGGQPEERSAHRLAARGNGDAS